MRYYLIAGEASGDLHGGKLIQALSGMDSKAEFRAWGGDKMREAGAVLVKHYKELAYMGFVEVAGHLPQIFKNLKVCKQDIQEFRPDVLILIDYPGFNLRIAPWAKKAGIRVCYYISPQVWAWKENRVTKIKASVDQLLVILPFEKEFYKKHHFEVTYVGHPLAETIAEQMKIPVQPLAQKPIIALLPGSRQQEIRMKLPLMLKMADRFPEYQFIVAKAPATELSLYRIFLDKYPSVILIEGQTYNLLKQAKAALVTSGTATLETALFGVPEVVCYKGNPLSYHLAKRLIKVNYISLVNLILNKPAVKELIQKELNLDNLEKELNLILKDSTRISQIQKDYKRLWDLLGNKKSSEEAAISILNLIQKR